MNWAFARARNLVRTATLTCIAALWFAGCARQHGTQSDRDDDNAAVPDDQTTRDPASGDGDASVSEPSISALLTGVFDAYQHDNETRCPCHVESGIYASIEECAELTARTSPRIDQCLDQAVPADLEPALRSWMRCLLVAVETHLACIEHASCDEQDDCRLDSSRCAFPDPIALSGALAKCPHAISSQP